MIKIIALSDSHNNKNLIDRLMPKLLEADYVITLGDMLNDYYKLEKKIGKRLYSVRGNCDCIDLPQERILSIGDLKILITHGHMYGVKLDYNKLYLRAKELNIDIALFGHTHKSEDIIEDGVRLINPGCLYKYSSKKSYCYMVINAKKVNAVIVREEYNNFL